MDTIHATIGLSIGDLRVGFGADHAVTGGTKGPRQHGFHPVPLRME
jgi:hypothetical protein